VSQGRLTRVLDTRLTLTDEPWPFARQHAREIDAHWDERRRTHPNYFNGAIHLMLSATKAVAPGGVLSARFVKTDFKSFLYWRETGYPPAGTADAFGSGIVVTSDGAVLLGRQSSGNINSGLAYPPGGFIDARDIDGSGRIDIDASIARELMEETGIDPAALTPRPGYLAVEIGPLVSIARVFQIDLTGEAVQARVAAHLAADPNPELAGVVLVWQGSDLDALGVPPFAQLEVEAVFAGA
jgi:8-oxo-dGTP pyrophosphatase MutT (NUDIX family)